MRTPFRHPSLPSGEGERGCEEAANDPERARTSENQANISRQVFFERFGLKFPIKMLAKVTAILVPMAVTCVWRCSVVVFFWNFGTEKLGFCAKN